MLKRNILLAVVSVGAILAVAFASMASEKTEQGYLGVFLQPVPEILAVHLGLAEGVGVVAADVAAEGPADKAGLMQHDVIVSMGGKEVRGQREFAEAIRASGAANKVKLGLISKGQKKEVEVILGALSEAQGQQPGEPKSGRRLLRDDETLPDLFERRSPGMPRVRPVPRFEPMPDMPEDIKPLIDPGSDLERWRLLEDRIARVEKQQIEILEKLDRLLAR
jgi:membrane-associated protease RseP (regulator of RpoE activity)